MVDGKYAIVSCSVFDSLQVIPLSLAVGQPILKRHEECANSVLNRNDTVHNNLVVHYPFAVRIVGEGMERQLSESIDDSGVQSNQVDLVGLWNLQKGLWGVHSYVAEKIDLLQ